MRIFFRSLAIAALVAAPAVSLAGEQQDKAAAEQIATILRDSGQMQNYSVGVKYKSGTVWLSGKVANDQQMQSALDVVGDIEGVRQIVNNMTIGNKSAGKSSAGRSKNVKASAVEAATVKSAATKRTASADGDVAPAGYHHLPGHRAARVVGPSAAVLAPVGSGGGPQQAAYDQPHMPNYAWPSYAASPNYAAVTYPKQYSATAWPFIGPFYPYPQVPLGWRKVSLEWDDGWWFLDFQDRNHH